MENKRLEQMIINSKPISVSFEDVVISAASLGQYEKDISKLRAGVIYTLNNSVVIYRYSISGNVSKDNKVAQRIAYYNAHRAQYIVYYKRLCQNYAAIPVKLVGANPYANILLNYVAEVSAIAEGFLVGNANPSKSDVLDAVLKTVKVLDRQKNIFAKEHMFSGLAGVALKVLPGDAKPVYDESFNKLCRQFLTFGNVCLLDLDKNSEQAKQIRKHFGDARKYYESRFAQDVKKNNGLNGRSFPVRPRCK